MGEPDSGGPRNRTWRCGFGDRRVTDTPVPRGGAEGDSRRRRLATVVRQLGPDDRRAAVATDAPAVCERVHDHESVACCAAGRRTHERGAEAAEALVADLDPDDPG